jgi:hypothetical protein
MDKCINQKQALFVQQLNWNVHQTVTEIVFYIVPYVALITLTYRFANVSFLIISRILFGYVLKKK